MILCQLAIQLGRTTVSLSSALSAKSLFSGFASSNATSSCGWTTAYAQVVQEILLFQLLVGDDVEALTVDPTRHCLAPVLHLLFLFHAVGILVG